jgi:peptidoglycan/xylan/chitin deacetylase (PgdA/CDA1 family)
LYVTQQRFAAQLDILAEVADVVPLADIDTPATAPRDVRPRVAITFDDAYQGAVTCAVDELEARRMSATIFVAPGCLGGRVFWWDALSHGAGHMDDAVRAHALETLAGSDAAIIAWARDSGIQVRTDLPAYARSATTRELQNAIARSGITVGSHTWSHVNVARVNEADLESEMNQSLSWLRAEAGSKCIPWLAYPYGLESDLSRRAAESAGYVFALRIEGGWHRRTDVPALARPRLNVGAGMSDNAFRARILGSLRA